MPEPATRSRTVRETSTSPGPARAAMRAPMCTASPRMSSARNLDLTRVHAGAENDVEGTQRLHQWPGRSERRERGRQRSRRTRRRRCRSPDRHHGPAVRGRVGDARPEDRPTPASPMSSAARRVESTMSVKSTVAKTRSGPGPGRAPVRNSSISPGPLPRRRAMAGGHRRTVSTSLAPVMRLAR